MRPCWIALLAILAACGNSPQASDYQTALSAFRAGELERAQELADDGFETSRSSEDPALHQSFRLLRAEVLLARGRPDEAVTLLGDQDAPSDPVQRLRWLVDRADALRRHNRPEEALALLDQVDAAAGQNADSDPVLLAGVLRGAILARDQRMEEAEAVLARTAARAKQAGNLYQEASALINLSFSRLRKSRYDESLRFSSQALAAGEQAAAGRIVSIAHNHLGIAYERLGEFERAQSHQERAIEFFEKVGDQYNLQEAYGALASLYGLTGEEDKAVAAYEKAVAIAEKVRSHAEASRWAGNLAMVLIDRDDLDAAEAWNDKAIHWRSLLRDDSAAPFLDLNAAAIAAGRGGDEQAVALYKQVIEHSADVPFLRWQAHARLADVLADQQRYQEANTEYEAALSLIEDSRARIGADDFKVTFLARLISFFEDYVDALLDQGRTERALQVVEYSRAKVLAERLGIQSDTIEDIDVDRLRAYAGRRRVTLLSFWVTPSRSIVWVVNGDAVRHFELAPTADLSRMVEAYRRLIEFEVEDPVGTDNALARDLRDALLGPIAGELGRTARIVVVPDGSLHALNLETLPGFSPGRYLIEEQEIVIAPSLAVLSDVERKPPAEPAVLLFGAPEAADDAYPELLSAREEIERIQTHFAPPACTVRTGGGATPDAFLGADPKRFSIIHFAAHAEANPQSPMESAVILSDGGGRYKLYARDIANLELSADLVTISGCRSAGARSYQGEGLIGFSWAFLRAGAKSVVAGLWDVGDQSSSALMPRFYQGVAAGESVPRALREAKISLLESEDGFNKPFYWAPYQVYVGY